MHKHKDEICRWANSPDGTAVWYKYRGIDWTLTKNPHWSPDVNYVVYDEWAELRKAQIDGKQLQMNPTKSGPWVDKELTIDNMDSGAPYMWRIKPPEVAYEWQWLYYFEHDDVIGVTEAFYSTEEEARNYIAKDVKVVKKWEQSKRIRGYVNNRNSV